MRMKITLLLLTLFGLFLAACGGETNVDEITLMTHDSFNVSEEVITMFEEENDVTVNILQAGDTGTALNQAILSADEPLADVFFGVDNTFLSRALEEDIFVPYESPVLEEIPDVFELDSSHRLLPVDVGDVCLNYDVEYFRDAGLRPPERLADLTDPAYGGLLVVENPATSSPGLAFLAATVEVFGEEGDYTYLDFWQDLRENDVRVTNDWTEAYYGNFTVAGDGDRPLVVSYASSPPAEVIFADPPVETAPSAAITAPDTCFRQIEFVGVMRGTEKEEMAQRLVDFMLSEPFQQDMPLNMFVFPVNEGTPLPPEFELWATVPADTANPGPAVIAERREAWIRAWTETVLQ